MSNEDNKEGKKSVATDSTDVIKNAPEYGDFEVQVDSNNIDRALKSLKRKLIREGFYKVIKQRRFYEKPSDKKKRKKKEAIKRIRKEQKSKLTILL